MSRMSDSSSDEETVWEETEETVEPCLKPGETVTNVKSHVERRVTNREVSPQIAVSNMDPSLKEVASELQEAIPNHNAVQQNFIQMNVQQTVTSKGSANLTFGGTQNVTYTPAAIDGLMKTTNSKIKTRTEGMVETAALRKVLTKLERGASWVTIKGCPGEGKTIAAYMALKKLHSDGRMVFDVTTPDEFTAVVNSGLENPVIMLDDVFGNLEFDRNEWSKWKTILIKALETNSSQTENESDEHEKGVPRKTINRFTVILIGREYVLKVCVSDLGKVADFFTHEKHVVNMSSKEPNDLQERFEIWKAVSNSSGIKLEDEVVKKICKIDVPHGFPHVCKLFVTLRQENDKFSAEEFFEKPLEFLNQTIAKVIQNKATCCLFKEMLKCSGKITFRELEDLDDLKIVRTAKSFVGTYLRNEEDCYVFDHPSVYDSVAYNLCREATKFVIENCDMSFIHERIRLETNGIQNSDTNLVFIIPRTWIPELAKRFADEMSANKLSKTLCHQAFTDKEFVGRTLSQVPGIAQFRAMCDIETGRRFLHLLSSNGSPEILKFLESQFDFKLEEWVNYNLFESVCFYGATDVLAYMVQKGFNINGQTMSNGDRCPIMMAARGRNKSFVDKILALNVDIHQRFYNGDTVLHVLVQNELSEAVVKAIEKGADVNAKNKTRSTPLFDACRCNNENIVRILIDNGAKVNCEDSVQRTPLIEACNNSNVNIVTLLIERGANIQGNSMSSKTVLVNACRGGYKDIVKLLVENGACINTKDTCMAALLAAIDSRNLELVKWLIDKGTFVGKEIYSHLLIRACTRSSLKIVKFLLDRGADVDTIDSYGNTPLHIASSEEWFNVLLEFNPNTLAVNLKGSTVLHAAVSHDLSRSVQSLLRKHPELVHAQNKSKDTPLLLATGKSDDCVELLLQAGADVNARNALGNTPLHQVVHSGNEESVRLLVNAGADVNAMNRNNMNPLFYLFASPSAVLNQGVVECLIKAKSDISLRDDHDNTLLHLAASFRNHQVIRLLLKEGVNAKLTNVRGETPLHILVEFFDYTADCFTTVKEMIRFGANVHSREISGRVPHQLVRPYISGAAEMKKLLVDSGAASDESSVR